MTTTTVTIQTAKSRAIDMLKMARSTNQKLLDGIPESKHFHQLFGTDGHIAWQLGHLATTNAFFAALIDGEPVGVSEKYNKLFGMGSVPTGDKNAYPPFAELKKAFDQTYDRFLAAATEMKDSDVGMPTCMDSGGFCKDRLHAIELAAWHEGWHGGQISNLRKAAGVKGIWG
jgi:uncharacterized damage-inducible protein DinB